jgi:hypothetical protein
MQYPTQNAHSRQLDKAEPLKSRMDAPLLTDKDA